MCERRGMRARVGVHARFLRERMNSLQCSCAWVCVRVYVRVCANDDGLVCARAYFFSSMAERDRKTIASRRFSL